MNGSRALGIRTVPYEFEGVKYELSEFDLEDYGKYELFLEESGWAALKRARQFQWITEYEYKEMVREWLVTLATHVLSFGSPDYIKSTNTLPGVTKMVELSLRHKHGEVDQKTIERICREDYAGVTLAMLALDDPTIDSA